MSALTSWLKAQSGLVATWSKSNGTQYRDDSGNDRHMTLVNATAFGHGIVGDPHNLMLRDLNGTDEYAFRASEAALQLSNFSMMAVVRFDALGSNEHVIGKFNPGTNNRQYVLFKRTDNKVRLSTSADGIAASHVSSVATLAADTIYVIGATYASGGTVKIYIDGSLVPTTGSGAASIFATGTSDLRFGIQGNGALPMAGDVGPCALFNVVKTDAVMLEWYHQIIRQHSQWHLQPGRAGILD